MDKRTKEQIKQALKEGKLVIIKKKNEVKIVGKNVLVIER